MKCPSCGNKLSRKPGICNSVWCGPSNRILPNHYHFICKNKTCPVINLEVEAGKQP